MPKEKRRNKESTVENVNQIACAFCNRLMNSAPALRYHLSICVFNPSSSRFSTTCCFCGLEEKSVEAIVDHLKANHSNENPPRFINGQFSKKKQKHSEGVIKPREAMVIPKFIEPLPSIYSQSPSFSIADYDLPNQDIHIIHHQQSSTIPIFQSISLDKHNYAINTGGCITSSCMFTHDDNLLIALSCMINQPQFPRFHRSTQDYHVDESSNQDGYISLYIQSKDKPILLYHILHHHSYLIHMQVLPTTNQQLSELYAILCCLYIDGVIELIPLPKLSYTQSTLLQIQPLISYSLDMRATCFTIHPSLSNTLLIGYEDGSIRTIHIQQTNQNKLEFHSVNLLRPQKSWFDSCPVRAIQLQQNYPNQLLIVDERGNIYLWDYEQNGECVCCCVNSDSVEDLYELKNSKDDNSYLVCGETSFRIIHIKNNEISLSKSLFDFPGNLFQVTRSEKNDMFFFVVDTGDVGIATFNSSEKLTCKGLTYGHIQEGTNQEEKCYELSQSVIKNRKDNKELQNHMTCSWLCCCCNTMKKNHVVGYGGLSNLFVIEVQ